MPKLDIEGYGEYDSHEEGPRFPAQATLRRLGPVDEALGAALDVVMLRADVAHCLPKREAIGRHVPRRHAQVSVFVAERLQVALHVLPPCIHLALDPPALPEPRESFAGLAVARAEVSSKS